MAAAVKALARPFVAVGDRVLVSKAAVSTAKRGSNDAPDVVLIFGWLDAQLPHLHKFTEGYHRLYPTADQILVRSDQSDLWALLWGQRRLNESLRPAIATLRARSITTLHSPSSSNVLVHVLSNGGCFQLTTFLRLLNDSELETDAIARRALGDDGVDVADRLSAPAKRDSESTSTPEAGNAIPGPDPTSTSSSPAQTDNISGDRGPGPAFIFDSSPGRASFLIMGRALTAPFIKRSPLLRALLFVPAGLSVLLFDLAGAVYWAIRGGRSWDASSPSTSTQAAEEKSEGRLRPVEHEPFTQMRLDLLNPLLIPPTAPRLYIFSESTPPGLDELVPAEDVLEHIAEAKGAGVRRIDVKRTRAGHVGHLRVDPEGYWEAVRRLWARE